MSRTSLKKPVASWKPTTPRDRFWINLNSGFFSPRIEDRSQAMKSINVIDIVEAKYICMALNHFHHYKTGRFENAA